MNHTLVKAVMFSQWKREKGCVPTRIVMWIKTEGHPEELKRRFVTHYEVLREDGHFDFTVGHYDMNLDEAKKDFDERCRLLGVKFSHFNPDYRS